MSRNEVEKACDPKLAVFPVDAARDPTDRLELAPEKLPACRCTLGGLGIAARVTGPKAFPTVILRQPLEPASLTGINARTVRVFRVEPETCSFRPVWDSGINVTLGFVWSRISRPGVYAPLGLPRDRLLFETLRALARARRYCETPEESQELTKRTFAPFLEAGDKEIEEIRELLTHLEIRTSAGAAVFLPGEVRLGRDGVPLPFPLPGGIGVRQLKKRLDELEVSPAGLPEEQLFLPPERADDAEPPWLILPQRPLPRPVPQPCPGEPLPSPWPPKDLWLPEDRLRQDERRLECLERFAGTSGIFSWLYPRNWWMHHRDEAHTGAASSSAIRRTNVGTLIQLPKITLDGPIISMPCIVEGKIYVGSSTVPDDTGGTLYKIDLATGKIEARFSFTDKEGDIHVPHAGVGSSPAVTGGKVYFSALTGKVYCLDAANLACRWVTDLRHTDCDQHQPVEHGNALANGWSSPLVVNDRVYVACGEGEMKTFGFVYCLNAVTGKVIWLFCTNRFADHVPNQPNVIPPRLWPRDCDPPPPFKRAASDPGQFGASPWSAPAYSAALDRIYIGTGNSDPDDPLPDPDYGSGVLSLDATTGTLKGFFQPLPSDSYRPREDHDVDVPAGPMIFHRGGKEYVCFGSKNGSFFILDALTMKVAKHGRRPARRQLLPYDSKGNPFPNVDRGSGLRENKSGVFGTAALAPRLRRIFIGLGGYGDVVTDDHAIDHETTPFIRAVDWVTLADAWPTRGNNPPKYCAAQPPVYCTPDEAGLSSPAVVNDVVFVSTTKPALYAFDAETGLCLWQAPGIKPVAGVFALGPAIYGNYVVNGISDGSLYIYSL